MGDETDMPQRAWRVREVKPDLFRAELFEKGKGMIYATAEAPWPKVRHMLKSCTDIRKIYWARLGDSNQWRRQP